MSATNNNNNNNNNSAPEPRCLCMENSKCSLFLLIATYVVTSVGFGVGIWQLERNDGNPSLQLACYLLLFGCGVLSFLRLSIVGRFFEKRSMEAHAEDLGTATKTDEEQGNNKDDIPEEGPGDSSPTIKFFLARVGFANFSCGVSGFVAAALDWSLEWQAAICLFNGICMSMVTILCLFLRITKHPQSAHVGNGTIGAFIATSVMTLYLGGRGIYLAHHM